MGMTLLHAWGMTETSPIGLVSRLPPDARRAPTRRRATACARSRACRRRSSTSACATRPGDVPARRHDQRRAPDAAARGSPRATPAATARSGGPPTAGSAPATSRASTQHGFVQLTDRIADLIKRGGEWIASQELENALMGHPAVREAAVDRRAAPEVERAPARGGRAQGRRAAPRPTSCARYLAAKFAKFWLPDAFVFVDAIPRTSRRQVQEDRAPRDLSRALRMNATGRCEDEPLVRFTGQRATCR